MIEAKISIELYDIDGGVVLELLGRQFLMHGRSYREIVPVRLFENRVPVTDNLVTLWDRTIDEILRVEFRARLESEAYCTECGIEVDLETVCDDCNKANECSNCGEPSNSELCVDCSEHLDREMERD